MRILLVDDDEQLMDVLANKLIEERYAVDVADTGEMGWEFILLFDFDLVILDWMLPDIDGVKLCRQIREKGYTMPIMLLSARNCHTDKVGALDAGADDYVVKPFDFDELTARIRALLRRELNIASPTIQWNGFSLDPLTHEVYYQQQLLPLTPKEYGIIELLMRHPQQVFSPDAIINNLWAGEDPPGGEAVRTHVKGLRQKLKAVGLDKDTITTIYGVGYRLKAIPDSNRTTRQQKHQAVVEQAWLKFQNLVLQRLAELEKLAVALTEENVSPEIYDRAQLSAHKLAGSLGCFGFPKGSKIAKQLQQLLEDNSSAAIEPARVQQLICDLQQELNHQPFAETVKDALSKSISLLIIDRNPDYVQKLAVQAHQHGMKIHVALDIEQAWAIVTQMSIDAVLHKMTFSNDVDLQFLEQLRERLPQLPIVAISESAQLPDLLDLVRKGANLTLQYPVEPSTAIDAVAEQIQTAKETAKILIVDDDPQVLISLEISLQPWGFELTTLSNPKHIREVLEDVEPDLLVLDIEMPGINGIELCQVLRSDRRWQQLPILFLSVHDDIKTQDRAFAFGADDYVNKPVTGSILANRILNRLRRNRIINS